MDFPSVRPYSMSRYKSEDLVELAQNDTNVLYNGTHTTMFVEDDYYYLTTSIAVICIVVGLIGLITRLNNESYNKLVRLIRCSELFSG